MLANPFVRQIVDSVTTMALAMCGEGVPHASPVYFVAD